MLCTRSRKCAANHDALRNRKAEVNATSQSRLELHDGAVSESEPALQHPEIAVLIFNTQTEGAVPDQNRGAAMSSSVPVVDVTENMPPKVASFVQWQLGQLQDLAAVVGA
jgi:hypothetical protein